MCSGFFFSRQIECLIEQVEKPLRVILTGDNAAKWPLARLTEAILEAVQYSLGKRSGLSKCNWIHNSAGRDVAGVPVGNKT